MENIDEFKVKVTIFTPTYNRAYKLCNLYKSLERQTNYEFEWIIVDDGSIDDTENIIKEWLRKDNPFPISYYKQDNGGKHRAINNALNLAQGKLFFIVDSDDYLKNNAIETIIKFVNSLPISITIKYAGVAGCKGYNEKKIVGSSFDGEYLDCLSYERTKYGIDGDKAEVYFTDILKLYPFPEFEGEKFMTEAIVWDRMALDGYYIRYFNEIIYLCEYLEDGLSNQGLDIYYKNPKGYGLYLKQSRKIKKFDKNTQLYFDVECFFHWKANNSIESIAENIGLDKYTLIYKVAFYKIREYGSKFKSLLLNVLKKG